MKDVREILKDGMVVEFMNFTRGIYYSGKILCDTHSIDIDSINEKGVHACYDSFLRETEFYPDTSIRRVYEPFEFSSIRDMFHNINSRETTKIIWKHEEDVNWDGVKKFTKVFVRDSEKEEWMPAYYIEHNDDGRKYKHYVSFREEFTYDEDENESFIYCKLYMEED